MPKGVAEGVFDLEIRRIITDSDLDGVVTGAILRRWWTDADVIFGHPGAVSYTHLTLPTTPYV